MASAFRKAQDAVFSWLNRLRFVATDRLAMESNAPLLALTAAFILGSSYIFGPYSWVIFKRYLIGVRPKGDGDHSKTDPSLLKKHSEFQPYNVRKTGYLYPSIRTFFRQHPQGDKLPVEPAPLPLLVFVHGLGGSAAQYGPLLTSLVNVGPCLCVDLPGCGLSSFEPQDWDAYSQNSLIELLAVIIDAHRDVEHGQKIVLFGHSMGCSLSAGLASRSDLGPLVAGFIALCPRITSFTAKQENALRNIVRIPNSIFNLMRAWDRRGGHDSQSVSRFAGDGADHETKKLTLRYNEQSRTAVWRRMAHGILPRRAGNSNEDTGLSKIEKWASINAPIFLISGESDNVTPSSELLALADQLRATWKEQGLLGEGSHRALKTTILPKPASHALLFAPGQVRIISGLVQSFLAYHIDSRLSLGWQLHYLSSEGKWDVKNFAKWQKIQAVSEPIARTFRAMKTMRQIDEHHSPQVFTKEWKGRIRAVVDISHEAPVYDPGDLEKGGIEYQKFPTVSKLPPTIEEVKGFNDLVDRLRAERNPQDHALIAVHCHYGFNRTGFFIVCYLVDRLGWRLQDAVDEFDRKRPPGIKHDYFVDELFVRYCVGLKKTPTI